ncbi:MAG: ribulose-phosphate 3-epimerase [Thermodesulfovibrionales bacterium]
MRIVPAILAETFEDFLLRLRQAELFADYVQIDIMDGIFVISKSFSPERINSINTPLSFEIHLMVKNPFYYMSRLDNSHLKTVIFHFESDVDHFSFINQIKKRGMDVGMAIKPETEIDWIKDVADKVDILMFLTVDPCCYGHPFKPEVIKKIEKARNIYKNKIIGVDGGVSLENLKSFFNIGVDYVCVGSRIFLDGNPGENYQKFLKRLHEIEFQGSIR